MPLHFVSPHRAEVREHSHRRRSLERKAYAVRETACAAPGRASDRTRETLEDELCVAFGLLVAKPVARELLEAMPGGMRTARPSDLHDASHSARRSQ